MGDRHQVFDRQAPFTGAARVVHCGARCWRGFSGYRRSPGARSRRRRSAATSRRSVRPAPRRAEHRRRGPVDNGRPSSLDVRRRSHYGMTAYRAPLDGIRVLELGSSVAGPAAGRLLADLGADVLKVEPGEGDMLRTWGPPAPDGTSWWFKSHNRNKRFLRFDLHDEADRATVRAIALQCDVLIENFRPGRLDAWGLGYESLRAENPRIVYASI